MTRLGAVREDGGEQTEGIGGYGAYVEEAGEVQMFNGVQGFLAPLLRRCTRCRVGRTRDVGFRGTCVKEAEDRRYRNLIVERRWKCE